MMVVWWARAFATVAHWSVGQRRKYTNERYINHPREVVSILSKHTSDKVTLASGWLHDVVEDTGFWGRVMKWVFPRAVVETVLQVTDVAKPSDGNRATRAAINLGHLAKASHRAVLVKLADITSNTKDIWEQDPKFAAVYLPEKLNVVGLFSYASDHPLWSEAAQTVAESFRKLGTQNV